MLLIFHFIFHAHFFIKANTHTHTHPYIGRNGLRLIFKYQTTWLLKLNQNRCLWILERILIYILWLFIIIIAVNGLFDNVLENVAVNLKCFSKMCLQSLESQINFLDKIYIYTRKLYIYNLYIWLENLSFTKLSSNKKAYKFYHNRFFFGGGRCVCFITVITTLIWAWIAG